MSETARKSLLWTSRLLGVLMALFLGMFALDAFPEGGSFREGVPHFLLHLLPSVALLAVVGVAWRRAWVGGVIFLALAVLYADWAWAHPIWIATVGLPLAAVGALYLFSWYHPHSPPRGG
jgi:hypothetical protein